MDGAIDYLMKNACNSIRYRLKSEVLNNINSNVATNISYIWKHK